METVILIIGVVNAVLLILILMRGGKVNIDTGSIVSSVKDGLSESQKQLREEVSGSVQSSVRSMSESLPLFSALSAKARRRDCTRRTSAFHRCREI